MTAVIAVLIGLTTAFGTAKHRLERERVAVTTANPVSPDCPSRQVAFTNLTRSDGRHWLLDETGHLCDSVSRRRVQIKWLRYGGDR